MILILGVADDKKSVNSLKKITFLFLINFFFFSLIQNQMKIYEINSIIVGKIILNDISSVFLPAVITTIFIVFMGLIDGINCLLSSISIFLLIILSFYINYELLRYMYCPCYNMNSPHKFRTKQAAKWYRACIILT